MRRRDLLTGALGISWAEGIHAAGAQTKRRARMGWLSGGPVSPDSPIHILKQTLHELGWKAGDTLDMEERHAQGDAAILPRLAAELVAQRPDVIGATGVTEAKALQAATRDIPIVFMQIAIDPVTAGLVASITRPGGNVTGFMQAPQLLTGKRLDLLTELLGRPPRRLGYISNPSSINIGPMRADATDAAARIGAEITHAEVNAPGEIDRVFDSVSDRDAVLVSFDFLLVGLRSRMAELAIRLRLPVMYENRLHVLAGGLMSYGGDLRENYRQGATYIDRILKGARPSDLPVVQGSRFELVLNTAAAKALGLTIPQSLLARADEVIE